MQLVHGSPDGDDPALAHDKRKSEFCLCTECTQRPDFAGDSSSSLDRVSCNQ